MKDIAGYEGLYAITEDGKVWSYRNNIFLKPHKTKKGYLTIQLKKNGTRKQFRIHRLVAIAYLDNPNNYPEVNHKDECKTNNLVENLEWCTGEYNNSYGIHAISNKPIYCRELDKTFRSAREAARTLNLNYKSIRGCCRGERKTTGGYHWQYVENV